MNPNGATAQAPPADGQGGGVPGQAPALGQAPAQPYGQAPAPGYAQPPGNMYGQQQNMYAPEPGIQTRTSGMAITGFVLSFFCGLLGLIFSLIGYNECKASNGTVGGEGLALAGIIISIVGMLLGLAIAVSGG
jgi:hypothetical protein